MLYLQPTRRSSGALRLIAGSHRLPLHEQLLPMVRLHSTPDGHTAHPRWQEQTFGVRGDCIPAYAAESLPGDLVIFHQACYHSVYGHQQGRSYIACKFAERPRTDFELASLWHTSDYSYRPHERFERHEDAAVRRMVVGLRALGPQAEALATGEFALSKIRGQRVVLSCPLLSCPTAALSSDHRDLRAQIAEGGEAAARL